MGRETSLRERIRGLEEKIHLLEKDNELLTSQSEDVLLLGIVTESVDRTRDWRQILGIGLERISMLKDIPYCVSGSVEDGRLALSESYLNFTDESALEREIIIPEAMNEGLRKGVQLYGRREVERIGLELGLNSDRFSPHSVLLVPFSARPVESGLFIFADDRPEVELAPMSELLQRVVEILITSMDKLYLLEELRRLNKVLDRKVEERTGELAAANRGLQDEIAYREKAEEALRRSEERFRLLVENAPDALYLHDRQGRFIDVNAHACRQLGYTRGELLRMSVAEVDVETTEESLEELLREVEPDQAVTAEGTHRHKDGTTFPVEVRIGVLESEERTLYLTLARDITERRQLEEQLRQAQKMESVGLLAGGIAHDFNNLLSTIFGFGELCLMTLSEGAPMAENIQEIVAAAERATGLTRQLLAFSRKQVLEMKSVDVNMLVEGAAKLLGRIIGEDISLRIDLAETVPGVLADPSQLEQVLMNLVVNARDAMPRGGTLTIETDAVDLDNEYSRIHQGVTSGRYVLLSVIDTGMGMTTEVQEKIFDPFFTTKDVGKGTGLGLATVYGIVKQHDGHIWVYSEPGKGSNFKIYIPIAADGELEGVPELSPEIPMGDETVLVVDDDAHIRKLVNKALSAMGFKVIVAESGKEALAHLEHLDGGIDLLLTDVIMPEMNGSELGRECRKRYPGIKIIYMSGYPDDHLLRHGVDKGTAFVQKPVIPTRLAIKIREVLDDGRQGDRQGDRQG